MSQPYKKNLNFGITDTIVLFVIGAIIFFFFSRMNNSLDYKWEWGSIADYLIHRDPDTGRLIPNFLLHGFITTIKLSFWSTLIAFVIGIFFGLMRFRGGLAQRFFSWVYVESIRNIPSLVLVFIFYFFISSHFLDNLGIDSFLRDASEFIRRISDFLFTGPESINLFISAIVTLGIYEGAYVTEIIRGGLLSVPEGQWDAGTALGMSEFQTFRKIIIPQALRNVLPPLAGQFISTIKDSAIMSVISVQELTFQGMELMAATFLTFEVWITITLLYFCLTFSLSGIAKRLEKQSYNKEISH